MQRPPLCAVGGELADSSLRPPTMAIRMLTSTPAAGGAGAVPRALPTVSERAQACPASRLHLPRSAIRTVSANLLPARSGTFVLSYLRTLFGVPRPSDGPSASPKRSNGLPDPSRGSPARERRADAGRKFDLDCNVPSYNRLRLSHSFLVIGSRRSSVVFPVRVQPQVNEGNNVPH